MNFAPFMSPASARKNRAETSERRRENKLTIAHARTRARERNVCFAHERVHEGGVTFRDAPTNLASGEHGAHQQTGETAMIRKIALGTALIVVTASGALANTSYEVENPVGYSQVWVNGQDAFAAAQRRARIAPQETKTFDRAADVADY
jgi:hypothetical protein